MIDRLFAPILGYYAQVSGVVKRKLFGANNETLDLIMDSFYRLSAEQRAAAIFGGGIFSVLLVTGVFVFYFASVQALEDELNESFNAIYEQCGWV